MLTYLVINIFSHYKVTNVYLELIPYPKKATALRAVHMKRRFIRDGGRSVNCFPVYFV